MKARQFTDQMNRSVCIPNNPHRIVSLVPSITELLFDLGMGDRVVGVTRFCIFPPEARKNPINIGGTKKLHLDRIRKIQPDLIIGNKEENTKAEIEALAREFPVWMSDVNTMAQGIEMIRRVGEICEISEKANALADAVNEAFDELTGVSFTRRLRVAYLIWNEPVMVAGSDNFINDVIWLSGFENVFGNQINGENNRYPEVSADALINSDPDLLLLSSEPYPFQQKHLLHFQNTLPNSRVLLVDGTMFSWYGSRMLKMPEYLNELKQEILPMI